MNISEIYLIRFKSQRVGKVMKERWTSTLGEADYNEKLYVELRKMNSS